MVQERSGTGSSDCRGKDGLHSLGSLMPRKGGPGDKARWILASVIYSIVLYGVQAWNGLMTAENWRKLEGAVTRHMLRVCRGYRTMSAAMA